MSAQRSSSEPSFSAKSCKDLTTHFPNREFHTQLCTSQALRVLPSHCAGIPPSVQQHTAKDKRASKRKLTYCYCLEPFLVQLCFRHPGEKDTGEERGRPVGGREKQKGKQNRNGAHTAVGGRKLEWWQRKPSSCVAVSHFWRHCRLAHGTIILVTGPVHAWLPVSQLYC